MTVPEPTSAPPEGRPVIWLFEGDLAVAVDAIEALFIEHDPAVCQRDGVIYVNLATGPVRADAELLRLRATRIADFQKVSPDYKVTLKPVIPRKQYFSALLHKAEWNFPVLPAGSAHCAAKRR
jgi:hypothetical protein